ncbi:MAG: chromate efflux transporter [Actinomycetota bacterium]|nr:chromate efflux transporter [Actinomycetota bacterium]
MSPDPSVPRSGPSPALGEQSDLSPGNSLGPVPFMEALKYWLRLGFINFGGPAGQIAIMHDELVDKKRWISNGRFLHALNFCTLLPGPEAQQLAIYIGWLLNGALGGIVAGILFVLPAFFLILGLSWAFVAHGDVAWVAAVFYGLKAAVIAIVFAAVIRIGSKALKNSPMVVIAAASFVAIFFVKMPFPWVIFAAAIAGLVGARLWPRLFSVSKEHAEADEVAVLGDEETARRRRPTLKRNLYVLLIGGAVWWSPLLIVLAWRGTDDTLSKEALFFSQAALVTFGGAYAVLAYINQAAVEQFGWLQPGEMATGLGLAESTPGPLIMVTQFVGFVAAYRFPGGLNPLTAATLGALVTVWATFAPCFLWIFLGAPYIERLRGNASLSAALSAITAAVVGVILNLAVTFAVFAVFMSVERGMLLSMTYPKPDLSSIDLFAAALAAVAFVGMFRHRWNVLWIVAGSALAGLTWQTLI